MEVAIIPIVLAAGLAFVGWLLKRAINGIDESIHGLDVSFSRAMGELAKEHARLEERSDNMNVRLVRVESWKDLHTFDHPEKGDRG